MPVRVGIVGRGFGRNVLAPAFEAAGAEIAFVCGRKEWKSRLKGSALDAVAIAVPAAAQYEIATSALRRGLGVFCEKPLAETAPRAQALARAAKQARLPAMIDFEFPETRAWRHAKRFLASGSLGRLRHAVIVWQVETYAVAHDPNSWKNAAAHGGGALNIFGSHLLYNVEWLFGPVKNVRARLRRGPAGETGADLFLTLAGGATVAVSISADAFMGSGHRVEAYGDRGSFILENPGADYMAGFSLKTTSRRSPNWKSVVKGRSGRAGEDGRIAPVSRMAGRFLSWIKTGKSAGPNLADGARVSKLVAAARTSDKKGRAVEVKRGR